MESSKIEMRFVLIAEIHKICNKLRYWSPALMNAIIFIFIILFYVFVKNIFNTFGIKLKNAAKIGSRRVN